MGMELQEQTDHPIIIEAKRWESKRGELEEEAAGQKRWARKAKEQKSRDGDCSRWPSDLSQLTHMNHKLSSPLPSPPQLTTPRRTQEMDGLLDGSRR